MRIVFILFLLFTGAEALAQSSQKDLQKASSFFYQGKYVDTLIELDTAALKLKSNRELNKQTLGLISYWRGICFNRLQKYNDAIINFESAVSLDYVPSDIHFEYGQALYSSNKPNEARIQFRESLKRKYKRGVSLYYIGYISKELGEIKKAFTFFRSINKLESEVPKEIIQAAEMQIGELYLLQIKNHSETLSTIEEYVIPQYKEAIEVDPSSELARILKDKISTFEKKYDLVLFKLVSGRPIQNPPYMFRFSQEFGYDSNVLFSPTDTVISKTRQSSAYSKTDVFGRYTFYFKDFLSITPEFRSNFTHYFNRVPEVYRNDNYLLAPAVRTAFEHKLWNRPAAVIFDYEYNESRRDVNAQKELDLSYRSHTLMVGEKFNFFDFGESLLKLRYRVLEGHTSGSDSNLASVIFEQLKGLELSTLMFYLSIDRFRVRDNRFDTNSVTLRTDLLLPEFRQWFSPSIGLAITATDPVNDEGTRGNELLINPSFRLSKKLGRNWQGNIKYDYQKNNSKDKENFSYSKSVYAMDLEYLF